MRSPLRAQPILIALLPYHSIVYSTLLLYCFDVYRRGVYPAPGFMVLLILCIDTFIAFMISLRETPRMWARARGEDGLGT